MTQIKLRRDTAANFTSKNPVLGVGEPAYETDTKKLKIGDGTTAYTQLEYFSAGGGGSADIGAALPLKIVNGVISLEVDGQTIQVVDGELHGNSNIFDIGKFTVIGSPVISEDGIASGFSTSNYINIPYDWAKNVTNFKITGKFKVENPVQGTNSILSYVTNGYAMGLSFNSTTISWFAIKTSADTPEDVNLYQRYSITPNIDYSYELQLNNNLYTFRLFDDTGSAVVNLSKSTSSPFSITDNFLRLGVSANYKPLNFMTGSIDLKQFSITVDGVKVFNGLMESTKPIYDKITNTNATLSTFQTDTDNNFSAVNSALNEKANLSDLALKQNKLTAGDNVTLTNLTDGTVRIDATCAGVELCDIGTALYVDETQGKRRYLNGQIVDINTNTQAFLNRLKEITTLHPSLLCTEEEWQTAKTMSAFGQVGKFVFNYSGDEIVSVRLPRVVNVQGLFDLQNLGMTVNESLPNIQGGVIGDIVGNYATLSGKPVTFTGAFKGVSTYTGTISGGNNHYQAITNLSFDANKSSPTYQNNAPVQPEAIQYPYFIQIATGSETENNIVNDIELNNPYSLFDSKYSDHELNNLSWLKSEGQWNAKAVYTDAYDKLLKVYNGTETVEGLSVKLSTETYTDYDFVLNTADETFRLPLLDGSEDLVSDRYIERSFTATNSGYIIPITKNGQISIRIYGNVATDVTVIKNGKSVGTFNLQSNAYRQGTITTQVVKGDEIKVFTNALKTTATCNYLFFENTGNGSLYYYVGETVQNANLIDAGRIEEQLATKTDMLQASGAGMPSNRYIDLALGASGSTYTAPADGWLCLAKGATQAGQYIQFNATETDLGSKNNLLLAVDAFTNGHVIGIHMPIAKGQSTKIYYDAGGPIYAFRFIYAEGSK